VKAVPGYSAWVIVAGLSILAALVLGTTYAALGLFVDPMRAEFGWTSAQAARSVAAFVLSMNLVLPLVGDLIDRIGPRAVMFWGVLVTSAAYGLASRTHTLPLMVGSFALAGLGVGACTYLPCTIVVSQWFEERRGLALGIIFGTSSAGSAVFPVILAGLASAHDWRVILAGIGASMACIGLPIVLGLVKIGPLTQAEKAADSARPRLRDTLKLKAYWLITSVLILSQLSFAGIYFYLVPFFSSVGFTAQTAAWFYGGTGIASFLGAVSFGPLSDKFGPKRMMIVALCALTAGSLLLLRSGTSVPGIAAGIAFVVLWGAVVSTPYQFAPMLMAEFAGLKNLGGLLGISNLLAGAASSCGPMMTGALFDAMHDYAPAFKCCAALAACSLLPAVLLPTGKRQSRAAL